jgi:hypothetical protein
MTTELALELAYVLGAICVVYKLAFLLRQTAFLPAPMVFPFRMAGLAIGTAICLKTARVVDSRADVSALDLAMLLACCAFLISVILIIGRRRNAW